MRAAIYARRSNEERGKADESKSVIRQVEKARAFAAKQGWTVADKHVFIDDAISGAEFEKRPGLQRLLSETRGRFDHLIVSERKSLGREQYETDYLIKKLDKLGVKVFEYEHGECLTPRDQHDKIKGSVDSYADESHRVKSSERVHDTHDHLIDRGFWTGGRIFGYKLVDVHGGVDRDGRPLKVGVKLEINEEQARVVRRAFELYAEGHGLRSVAKTLNLEGLPSPELLKYRDSRPVAAGWKAGTIRSLVSRELYRGVHVWNRSRKRDQVWGDVDQKPRPQSEHKRTDWPWCRIVSDELWENAQRRRRDVESRSVRFKSGHLGGRPRRNEVINLLAGLASCRLCGGGMVVETSARMGGRVYEYACRTRRHQGTCPNIKRVDREVVHEAVLVGMEEHVLVPGRVEEFIQLTERDDLAEVAKRTARERLDLERKLKRWADKYEQGDDLAWERVEELRAKLKALPSAFGPVPRLEPAVVEDRLGEWRRLLRQSTTQARAVLQRVLLGRLCARPLGVEVPTRMDHRARLEWLMANFALLEEMCEAAGGYELTGETRFDRLFTGIAAPSAAWMKPYEGDRRGVEHITTDDTFEGDYGRLLEEAHRALDRGQLLASPTGLEPVFLP